MGNNGDGVAGERDIQNRIRKAGVVFNMLNNIGYCNIKFIILNVVFSSKVSYYKHTKFWGSVSVITTSRLQMFFKINTFTESLDVEVLFGMTKCKQIRFYSNGENFEWSDIPWRGECVESLQWNP